MLCEQIQMQANANWRWQISGIIMADASISPPPPPPPSEPPLLPPTPFSFLEEAGSDSQESIEENDHIRVSVSSGGGAAAISRLSVLDDGDLPPSLRRSDGDVNEEDGDDKVRRASIEPWQRRLDELMMTEDAYRKHLEPSWS